MSASLSNLDHLSRPAGRCRVAGCSAPAVAWRLDENGTKGGCCKFCARLSKLDRSFRKGR